MADIKLFISSVQAEFANERRQLYEYIRRDALLSQFITPFIFEALPALEVSAQQAYLSEAADCDIYIGLFGTKYGYRDEQGVSPTEREYDIATVNHAHRFIYILDTDQEREQEEQELIRKAEREVVRKTFTDFDSLKTAVYSSLIHYLEIKEIIRKVPFDAAPHPTATLDAIDSEKVRLFVELAKEKRQFKLPFEAGVKNILSAVNVLTDDGRLTNAALLLFGKNPQQYFITSEVKCAQFYGTIVEKPIKNYQVYRGTLFEMINQAVGFVMSRVDANVGQRDISTDVPIHYELPESAVTEAIVNAIAHRDYTSNASVQVMLFRDRLEVWNPGHLPYGLTTEQLRELHASDPTNPTIAHPLFLTGAIERLGTGTTDMIAACESEGLRTPEFHQEANFRVVIWRKKSNIAEPESNIAEPESNMAEIKSNIADVKLTKKQKMVLEFCSETPRTGKEILEFVGVKRQTKTYVQYITKLVQLGLLRPTQLKQTSPDSRFIATHNE